MAETKKSSQEFVPEPAESFEIEFMNARGIEITSKMSEMGFAFRAGDSVGGKVKFEGDRSNGDGTKIEIIITKGEGYKSPKELKEILEAEAKKNNG